MTPDTRFDVDAFPELAGPIEPLFAGEPVFDRAARILAGDIRPGDYLPITDEIRAKTARDMEFAYARGKKYGITEFDPEVEQRQRDQWTLICHHAGEMLAYIKDDRGYLVLASGWPTVEELCRRIPVEDRTHVLLGSVDPY